MPSTFLTDFEADVTILVTAANDQSGARGDVHNGVEDQAQALAGCKLYVSTARDIAKKAFRTNDAVLRTEFTVGEHTPHGMDNILARAETVHAACAKYAEELAAKGWPATDTPKLAELIAALKSANTSRDSATAAQQGATAVQVNLANRVYEQIRLVQIAANIVYPTAKAESDGTIVESRAQFLLGVFPPQRNAAATDTTTTPAPSTAPTVPTTPPATDS
jgi:hypothetical protein